MVDRMFNGPLAFLNQWPYNLHFRRPLRRRPLAAVKGGRWSIRKDPEPVGSHIAKPWRAWASGKASKWNRWFATQEEAIAWATYVAQCYAAKPPVEVHWPKRVPALTSLAADDSIGP